MTNEQLWQAVLGELELLISRPNFTTWFTNTFIASNNEGVFVVGVPNTFTKAWLENKYHDSIIKALKNITDADGVDVTYRVESPATTSTNVSAPVVERLNHNCHVFTSVKSREFESDIIT